MIRKFKALGLALVAVMALSGVAAAGAQAVSEVHIRSGKSAVLTSDETLVQHTLQLGTIEPVRCQQAEFEGTVTGSGGTEQRFSHIIVTANYGHPSGQCQWFGEAATVQMNGCKYTLEGTVDALRAKAKVVGCTTGKQITIQTSICQLHIGEQGLLDHIVFENRNAEPTRKEDVDVIATVGGIAVQKRGVFCPSATTASFAGETTVQAYEDNGTVQQRTVTEHQYNMTNDNGVELGILAT